jgi:hypothetical protein
MCIQTIPSHGYNLTILAARNTGCRVAGVYDRFRAAFIQRGVAAAAGEGVIVRGRNSSLPSIS